MTSYHDEREAETRGRLRLVDLPPPEPAPTNNLLAPATSARADLPAPTSTAPSVLSSPLRVTGLTKSFGTKLAINNLSFAVPQGACYGLVGPNGSGKSTTMRTVVGLVRPDAGSIEVCGIDVAQDVMATRRAMGVMLDPLQLFDRLTAWEFVDTIGALRGLDTATVRDRATELFDVLDLSEDARRPIAGYSHGMRKKTALAVAMLPRPQLVMLDEPTNDLDLDTLRSLEDFLDTWPGALIAASHDRAFLDRVADHVLAIEPGGTMRRVAGGVGGWLIERAKIGDPIALRLRLPAR